MPQSSYLSWKGGFLYFYPLLSQRTITGAFVGAGGFEPPTSWSQTALIKRRSPLASFLQVDYTGIRLWGQASASEV